MSRAHSGELVKISVRKSHLTIIIFRNVNTWGRDKKLLYGRVYGNQLQTIWGKWTDAYTTLEPFVPDDIIAQIKCPVLILHGDKDFLVHPLHAMDLKSKIKGAKMYMMKGTHDVHKEQPREFNMIVQRFVLELN